MTAKRRMVSSLARKAWPTILGAASSASLLVLLGKQDDKKTNNNNQKEEQRINTFLFSSSTKIASCQSVSDPSSARRITRPPERRPTLFGRNFVADAVQQVLPAVVRLEVYTSTAAAKSNEKDEEEMGNGSGIIVQANEVIPGHEGVFIITNAHCVLTPTEFAAQQQQEQQQCDEDDAKSVQNATAIGSLAHNNNNNKNINNENRHIWIQTSQGDSFTGKLVAFNVERDVALIQPCWDDSSKQQQQKEQKPREDEVTKENCALSPALLVDECKRLYAGEFVVAVGAPFQLENSVTMGIVSNPNRYMKTHNNNNINKRHRYIQTDAMVHIGNSGGPLVNMDGQVIGINTLKIAQGVTYVIPIHDAIADLQEAAVRQFVMFPKGKQQEGTREKRINNEGIDCEAEHQ